MTVTPLRKPAPDEKLGEFMGVKQHAPKKLDIASGQNTTKGFKGIDLYGEPDIRHDLLSFPWPIKANSVSEVTCNHFLEHIPHHRDAWGEVDGFWLFFDELYRICKRDATLKFTHPYVWNDRAFWDPTHVRFLHEMAYCYLDKGWRLAQGLDHYPVSCDFEVVTISAGLSDEMLLRSEQQQNYARLHYRNAVGDLEVILRARK